MSLDARVTAAMDKAIADKRIVGSVVQISRGGELMFSRAAGLADREAGTPVKEDTLFRFASVTKPFVAVTALAMVDKGHLGLEDRVRDYLPWFHPSTDDGEEADIRIWHLLTHTSGLDYVCVTPDGERIDGGLADTRRGYKENFSLLNKKPLVFAPGCGWTYSLAMDILGALISTAYGGTLEQAMWKYVATPLGTKDARFFVADHDRLAVPYADGVPEPVRMADLHRVYQNGHLVQVYAPTRIFNPNAYQSGGAGMAGTADDVLKLLENLVLPERSVLQPETAQAALSNQIGPVYAGPGAKFSFVGEVVHDRAAYQSALPLGANTWGGVYGNCWSIDPASKTVAVIMTNTAVEGCNGAYPEEIWQAIYGN